MLAGPPMKDQRDILEVLEDPGYIGQQAIFARAADEIRRQRAALENICNMPWSKKISVRTVADMRGIARAALKAERAKMTDDQTPEMQAMDQRTGKPADLSVLEEAGVAYDPTQQHLDLSKDEKRRVTALLMAIQAYRELIIKEAGYLEKVADLARRNEGPAIKPATIDAMVDAAFKFDAFIAGHTQADIAEATRGGEQTTTAATAEGESGG